MKIKQAKNLHNCTGSSHFHWHPDPAFDPDAIGKEVLGEWGYGNMFAYLFRRFGYPAFGWDGDKEMFGYTLTTPMKGVYLYVNQNGFAYRAKKEIESKLNDENRSPRFEYRVRLRDWALKNHGVTLFDMWDWSETPEQHKVLLQWLRQNHKAESDTGVVGLDTKILEDHYPTTMDDRAILQSFWDFLQEQHQLYWDLYQSVEVAPPRDASIESGSLRDKVVNAFRAAINDLLRPVNVHDWQINCLGKSDRRSVEPSYMSGYGACLLSEAYQPSQVEDYFIAIAALKRIGSGNTVKGMKIALENLASSSKNDRSST